MLSLNIYCDESTHLPNDGRPYMVLGAIVCPVSRSRDVVDPHGVGERLGPSGL